MAFIYKPIRQYMVPNEIAVNPQEPIDFSTIITGQICRAYRLRVYDLNNILQTGSSAFNKTTLTNPLYNGDKLIATVPAGILPIGQSYKWQIELFANNQTVAVSTSDNTLTAYNHNLQTGDMVYVSIGANGSYPATREITSTSTTADGTVSVSSDTFLSFHSTVGSYVFTVNRQITDSSTTVSGASVTIDSSKFLNHTSNAGKYKFKHNGTAWEYNTTTIQLSDYGITLTGSGTITPVINDTITVVTQLAWKDSGGTPVTLSAYGITLTGTGTDGDTITVTVGSSALQEFTTYYVRPITSNSLALFKYLEGARTNSGRIWLETAGLEVAISNVAVSEQVVFEAYGLPTVELLDSSTTITSQSKTFQPSYSHPQQIGIKSFTASIKLHNSTEILETSGEQANINLQYTFGGLQTGYSYDIKFDVTDLLDQVCTTGWVAYSVLYTIPDISVHPTIESNDSGSAAIIKWGHISTTVGEVRDSNNQPIDNPTYVDNFVVPGNKAVSVPIGGTLRFTQLQINSIEALPTFWWRPTSTTFSGNIVQYSNSTTGSYVRIGYSSEVHKFYITIDGRTAYSSIYQLAANTAYNIGYVNYQVDVRQISTN